MTITSVVTLPSHSPVDLNCIQLGAPGLDALYVKVTWGEGLAGYTGTFRFYTLSDYPDEPQYLIAVKLP